jgi:hypothetical protein
MHLERDHQTANFIGDPGELKPMLRRHRRERVVIVQLDIDLDGAAFLLRAQGRFEFSGVAARDKAQQMLEAMLVGQAAMFGRELGGNAIETGFGDGRDFLGQRPFGFGRRVTNERPEISDVCDLGHIDRLTTARRKSKCEGVVQRIDHVFLPRRLR